MRLTDTQRHTLHMLITRCDGGVFDWWGGRAYAAANTLESLERHGLIAMVGKPLLYAVSKSGRVEARPLDQAPSRPLSRSTGENFQLALPLEG